MASKLTVDMFSSGCKLIELREDGTEIHHPITSAVAKALIDGGVAGAPRTTKAPKRAKLMAANGIVRDSGIDFSIHHPGSDKHGHPVSECAERGCTKEQRNTDNRQ